MGRIALLVMLAAAVGRAEGVEERVAMLRSALVLQPDNLNLRKDFGYALLKAGETEAAREQFGLAWQAAPDDQQAGLEFAYLCHETRRVGEARRTFERLAAQGNAQAREAFQRIDASLAAEIARWQEAARATPGKFSVHHELAQRTEERSEFALAAEHYRTAWRLKPVDRMLLVDAQRCHRAAGDAEGARITGIAAYWSPQTRASEEAGAPERYPYVYEFEGALELDPKNPVLRRELGFLLLAMERDADAEAHFEILAREHPEDLWPVAQLGFLLLKRNDLDRAIPLLEGALAHADPELAGRIRKGLQLPAQLQPRTISAVPEVEDIRALADRSYEAGYLRDAQRYYALALERSPRDHNLMLRLGWTSNVLKQDREAIRWFDKARASEDPTVARTAETAYRNLRPDYAPVRFTAWMFPLFSTRWHSGIGYAQTKAEFRLGKLPVRPYLSVRLIGDSGRRAVLGNGATPAALSENSAILGGGVAMRLPKGITLWGEAGSSLAWRGERKGSLLPDYRAGLSYAKGFGAMLGGKRNGAFFANSTDAVYLSRFGDDTLAYLQNRAGYTVRAVGQWQWYWMLNATADAKRQWWGNFWETGPGMRLRFAWMPASMFLTVEVARGTHFVREGITMPAVYTDVRAGLWYAATH